MRANEYRTHVSTEIGEQCIGEVVRAAGWVETVRDHGGVLFVDLRDHYGIVQVVLYDDTMMKDIARESAVSVSGTVVRRSEDTVNDKIATGTVEIKADSLTLLGACRNALPF